MSEIVNVKKLAAYISKKIFEKTNTQISPVRLQKTLYFAFAYWGAFVRLGRMQESKEIDVSIYPEYLFNARIEAWVYGPVIPEVYSETNIERYEDENLFQEYPAVQEFVDNIIEETMAVNDFKLVDISHMDNAWKSKFDYDEVQHKNEINKEEIIEEYARRK